MKPNENEILYRDIACRYAEILGSDLLGELAQAPSAPAPDTAPLDRKVRGEIRALRLRRLQPVFGLIAAAALVVIVLAGIPGAIKNGQTAEPPGDGSVGGEAPSEPSVPPDGGYEAIPLGFELPQGLSVSDVEVDREKTVYFLESKMGDDIVMTLRREGIFDTADLNKTLIGDTLVYYADRVDYCILTFETGDTIYEMTCKYDLSTLLSLAEQIV